MMTFIPNNSLTVIRRKPFATIRYEAVGGASSPLATVRELVELRELVKLSLKHPELMTKLGINTPHGVLLTGPSGPIIPYGEYSFV